MSEDLFHKHYEGESAVETCANLFHYLKWICGNSADLYKTKN